MKIRRDSYVKELIDRKHNGMVKIITGIRRSGKSYLLFNLFYDYLISENVTQDHIIKIELDQLANIQYRNPFELDAYIRSKIEKTDSMCYVFIDEIQFVENVENPYVKDGKLIGFYDVLNGLLGLPNVDLYVTGSNSKMLSKDVLTEFRGRGDEIHVHPLSFSEFMSVYSSDKFDGWLEYSTYGGLPAILAQNSESKKIAYLKNLFTETYIKDIIERNNVRNTEELEEVLNVLASAIGSLTNPTKLENTFKSEKNVNLSKNTIHNYLNYFEDSFLLHKVNRYDIKGRKYINVQSKFYFSDMGLRNVRLNFRQQEENHIMENIIYIELLRRHYIVDIGIVEVNERNEDKSYSKKQLEVDFIANKGSQKYYIQSALNLDSEQKIRQEKKSLLNIDDSFKKILIVKDYRKVSCDESGIVIMSIYDFLLSENSLNL